MSKATAKRLVIKNGTLIDGTGKPAAPNTAIVIEGNKITSVGAASNPASEAGATVIDATGKYIMPGLIDGHVHRSSHQGAIPGVRYTSSPDFAALWTARHASHFLTAGGIGRA